MGAREVRGLRREAALLRRAEPRRQDFPTTLQLGRLDRWPATTERHLLPRPCDEALRTDLVTALLLDARVDEGAVGPLQCWVARCGQPAVDDDDLCWWRAVRCAAGCLDVAPPPLLVVTRCGWSRPGTDEGQRWDRLRVVIPR